MNINFRKGEGVGFPLIYIFLWMSNILDLAAIKPKKGHNSFAFVNRSFTLYPSTIEF